MGLLSVLPHGCWPSPITARAAGRAARRYSQVVRADRALWWVESLPEEDGAQAVFRALDGGAPERLTPPGWSARTGVLTYGGRALTAERERAWATLRRPDAPGQERLHLLEPGSPPRALTPPAPLRYAEPALDLGRGRLVCTLEDGRRLDASGQPRLALAAVPLAGGPPELLVEGRRFTCAPRLSPCGRRLAWLAWDPPQMPWDGAELWLAELDAEGRPQGARRLAGGPDEACGEPGFLPSGELVFLSDRGGGWRLYVWDEAGPVELPGPPGELGVPQWRLGPSTWAPLDARRLVVAATQEGIWSLHRVCRDSGEVEALETGCTWLSEVAADAEGVAFVGASPQRPAALLRLRPAAAPEVLRSSAPPELERWTGFLSAPEPLRFPTSEGGQAYASYFPPTSATHRGPEGERPPLIVRSHGGPTSAHRRALDLEVQFFTSRGFGLVDVDYRGSSGYGRAYRLALYGRWGELDLDDALAAARHLADAGRVDGQRLLARGGSAGGFTTLGLAAFREGLLGGVSYFGVADLTTISVPSNPLEFHYPERLVGPWPEAEALYRARSPRFHAAQIRCPMLFLHGEEDRGVPVQQTLDMVAAMRAAGTPAVALILPGEGHGFTRADNIERCLALELAFYQAALGLTAPAAAPLDLQREGLP